MKTAPQISLTEEERTTLTLWSRLIEPTRLALRARILLLAADGTPNKEIARRLQASTKTVSMWRRRFQARRLAGIEKAAPRGKPQAETDRPIAHLILQKTLDRSRNLVESRAASCTPITPAAAPPARW